MKENLTEIIFILDRSGSMAALAGDTPSLSRRGRLMAMLWSQRCFLTTTMSFCIMEWI